MIRTVHQGLGPIGIATAKLCKEDPGIIIAGLSDIKPAENLYGLTARKDTKALLREAKPDVLIIATCSILDKIIGSIEDAAAEGVNVVTSAEEMFYPEYISKETAQYLNSLGERYGVSITGRGVNPGCLMDAFPLETFRESKMDSLEYISVTRHDDTTHRRNSVLNKTGAGRLPEDFANLGHVGLTMSATYLADNLNIRDYELEFNREPVIAERPLYPTQGNPINPGEIAGLHETCLVKTNGRTVISLDLQMYVGAKNENSVYIRGQRKGAQTEHKRSYNNIVNGDIATARILRHTIHQAVSAPYGLNRAPYPGPEILL